MTYGRLMLDLEGVELTVDELTLLKNPQVGGVILFARNIQTAAQVSQLVGDIRAVSDRILIAVDQEGGRVQRLRQGFTLLPPMQTLGDLIAENRNLGLALARDSGWLMASEVLACGLDISFAPVLDVDRDTSSIIRDRAFSDQPEAVIDAASAFIEGMHEAGMAATGKHFPGHGGIVADSHLEAPVDHRSWQQLEDHDLKPFAALSGKLDGIMPAHITYPAIDRHAVGFSKFWLQTVLRQQLNFTGAIFSDDLSMKGADVAGGFADKAKLALEAGCDMILVCNCREGALEVLDYMDNHFTSPSDKLEALRGRGKIGWDQLATHPRRLQTIEQLDRLMA